MEEGVVVAESDTDLVLIQVRIPDLKAEKCLQFCREERVWDVKQQILAAMPKELEDSFNYGLFQPPLNGRAGKFLDEERRLAEYPFQASVGHLELKFKRRVYKMLNLDEKQLKSINSRANLKKFLEHVMANNVEKVNKMCNKGLDPNFHCLESGETPLSLISGIRSKPSRMVMALVNGGAILDFRTKDGSTAMHRAVTTNNVETVRTMLELGASPNYRDSKNLTPLYHSVIQDTDPVITETLLHDHATTGAQDLQGWQEVHQVCRSGMVQHLEHLLCYGADMNSHNASGNTPLHVCAVNNQDSCARLLLFRGADKECLNYAGQTAYQVAVIAGNLELAEVIQSHKQEDIVPFKEAPKYNPRRRVSGAPLARTMSDCGSLQYDTLRRVESPLTGSFILKPASPSLSDRSLPPFSSGSSISETSTGSGGSNSTSSREEEQLDSASTLAASIADQQSDVLSVSSGVGTSSNSGSGGSAATPTEREVMFIPGVTVVSLENYNPRDPSHLKLSQGDVIEVTGSTDSGLMEGTLRGLSGYFPRHVVEEVRVRSEARVAGRREVKHFGTLGPVRGNIALRVGAPRNCVLHKGKKGFGFVLRGAKAASPLMDMIPSDRCPSLQYMDDVDPGGVADMAGVNKGDFLLSINGEDVTQASHERVVTLIRQSGELVSLSVVTLTPELPGSSATLPTPHRQFSTLPRKPPGSSGVRSPLQHPPPPPKRDPNTTLSVGRARAKSMVANMAAMDALDAAIKGNDMSGLSAVTGEGAQGQANGVSPKVKNVAQELELIFKREAGLTAGVAPGPNRDTSPAAGDKKKVYTSVAQMKRSRKGSVSSVELNNLHKDYHSTPDLQTNGGSRDQNTRDMEEVNQTEPRRRHSQEDLHVAHLAAEDHPGYFTLPHKRSGSTLQGEEEYRTITRIRPIQTRSNSVGASYHRTSPNKEGSAGAAGPAPSHPPPPPPPPPTNNAADYAKVGLTQEAPVSSFNPASNARLYESPKEVGNIGYKSTQNKQNGTSESKKRSPTRTHSLPPRPTRPMVLKRIEDPAASTETYSVNGVNYTTYTTFRSPITPEECPDSVSGRLFPEASEESAETPTTPTNEGYRESGPEPHIPEPDYDMSDVDNQSYSGSESGSWRDTTATLRRNMRNTTERDRKKKKTVSFIMNEELANIIHSSGTMTKKDSILKDPSRERENGDDGKGRWRSTKRSPTKVSPPMPETPKTPSEPTFNSFLGDESSSKSVSKGSAHPAWEGGSIVEPSNGQESPPKLVSNSKIRIEVGPSPGVTQSSTLPRSSHSLQKSHSFSAELSPGAQYRNTTNKPRLDTGGIISQADLQRAKLHLKSSRSFPELLEDGDNSSSGVSSDQDQDSVNIPCEHKESEQTGKEFVTQLTVSNGADKKTSKSWAERRQRPGENFECESNSSQSETDNTTQDNTWVLRPEKKKDSATSSNGGQVKHVTVATSTVQTKPSSINKSKKNVSITGANLEKVGPVHIEWSTPGEENHYQNFATMMQQRNTMGDHVNVRRPFNSNEDVMSKSYHGGVEGRLGRRQAGTDIMSQSLIQSDKSIEHSLALIRHHVKVCIAQEPGPDSLSSVSQGLSDVEVYGGVPPPPPSEPCSLPSVCPAPLALAPPPGFSDSEHSLSDTDSLGSEPNNFQRFGFSRVSKPRSLAVRQDRLMPQAQYSGGVRKSASGVLESPPAQNYLSGSVQKEFRGKSLVDWTVTDVCDWLDSLFMPEYKAAFLQNSINGYRLAALQLEDWSRLGVGKTSHRLNIQKSIKRYMTKH